MTRDHKHKIETRRYARSKWIATVDGRALTARNGRVRLFGSEGTALEAADLSAWCMDQKQEETNAR